MVQGLGDEGVGFRRRTSSRFSFSCRKTPFGSASRLASLGSIWFNARNFKSYDSFTRREFEMWTRVLLLAACFVLIFVITMIIIGHLNIIAPQWLVALLVGLLLIAIMTAWKR